MEKTFVSVAELSRRLQSREVSAVELARDYLERIEAGRSLNAFLDVRPEETIRQAEEADRRIAAGEATPLTGIPIAHKDIFVTKEWASTAASRMLEGYMSPFDATVVRSLKDAGMVCMGKLNCDEFAMGSGNENSAYGRVGNLGCQCRSRRLVGRFSRSCRCRVGADCNRNGYGRFHSRTRRVLRHYRHEAYIRPAVPTRHDCLCFVSRYRRPSWSVGGRLRHGARLHGWP